MHIGDSENPQNKADITSGRSFLCSAVLPVRYFVITPSRDEEQFIVGTIESVISQTMANEEKCMWIRPPSQKPLEPLLIVGHIAAFSK